MIEKTLDCPGPPAHRLAYYEWAGPQGTNGRVRTVLCLHGLTRNGRDFDILAQALSSDFRVVCPDMPGRGRSQWLDDPMAYDYPLYLADMAALIAALAVETVDLVGTSMGGIIGMLMAARPNSPIRRLVINDVGPLIAKQGLKRIRRYVGLDPSFKDLAALETALRSIFAGFGDLPDDIWRSMAAHSARIKPNGRLGLDYDPKIAAPFKKGLVRQGRRSLEILRCRHLPGAGAARRGVRHPARGRRRGDDGSVARAPVWSSFPVSAMRRR